MATDITSRADITSQVLSHLCDKSYHKIYRLTLTKMVIPLIKAKRMSVFFFKFLYPVEW